MASRLEVDLRRVLPDGTRVAARFEAGAHGPVTAIFGPSGAGKTTVLRALAGLDRPDAGRIALDGDVFFDAERGVNVPPHARRTGYVAQRPALFPHLDVQDNVAFGLRGLSRQRREDRLREVVALLDLTSLAPRRVHTLSGGEIQRVSLARALANAPRLLLLDEPLSALDGPARTALRSELRRVFEATRLPVVLVTHDRDEALALADTVVALVAGRVEQVGTGDGVFGRPATLAVARMVGVETVLPARVMEVSDGLASIGVQEGGRAVTLHAMSEEGLGDEVWACIRGDEVILERPGDAATSARNRLPAIVRRIVPEGRLVRIELDAGVPLVALVTRQAVSELPIVLDEAVIALVKAPSIHLLPRRHGA